MDKNDIEEVDIIDNGINLEGIAKKYNKVIFIKNAIKEEKISTKILKVNKNFAYGKINKIIKKSKDRIDSICDVYDICGSCDALHMNYDLELKTKEKNVLDTMKKNKISFNKYDGIYGMGIYYNYRNKVSYPVRNLNGKDKIGFYRSNSHDIIENNHCYIQNEIIDKLAKDIFNKLIELKFSMYNETSFKGDIKHIVLRRGYHTGDILVTIVVNNKDILDDERFEKISSLNENIKSIYINLNDKNNNQILGEKYNLIYGKEYIQDYICKYKFNITPSSFFQINTIQTEVLYNILKENLKLNKDDILFDLYSGVGTIGIFLSESVKKVYGIEIDKKAVENANLNISLNNLNNLEYIPGKVEDKIIEFEKRNIIPNVIVVDPPRKGLDDKSIEYILKFNPEKIGYISCNYATLARDLKKLENKYEFKNLALVDMFPRTKHIECVVYLERK